MTHILKTAFLPLSMLLLLILLLSYGVHVFASSETVPIDHIIQQKHAPAGVVFEIVSDDEALLDTLLPELNKAVTALRKKFPELAIAIVAHGKEQFALMSKNRDSEAGTHRLIKALSNEAVDVHVCGTHASWYGIEAEDFPDYVDVTSAGPTKIDDYEAMGYELIVLTD